MPTAQQRRFSVDWDPIQSVVSSMYKLLADLICSNAPPSQSRPEAANFPNQTYEMSQDRHLFQAPSKYPEPPKDMHYEVPKEQPSRPKPIFPWETNQRKPARVFADDPRPAPLVATPSVTTDDDSQTETISPSTPTISLTSPDPLTTVSRNNAWDDMPEIDRYIANLPQNRRAKVQVLFNNAQGSSETGDQSIMSPGTEVPPQQQDRRGSMKVTDFPTEIERPSLPVTPAPVRRPSFWGEERDAAGDLPGAEGVPEQSQWNPVERLAELQRRQSEVIEKGPQISPRQIPNRQSLASAAPIPEEPTSPTAQPTTASSGIPVVKPAESKDSTPTEATDPPPRTTAALPESSAAESSLGIESENKIPSGPEEQTALSEGAATSLPATPTPVPIPGPLNFGGGTPNE